MWLHIRSSNLPCVASTQIHLKEQKATKQYIKVLHQEKNAFTDNFEIKYKLF